MQSSRTHRVGRGGSRRRRGRDADPARPATRASPVPADDASAAARAHGAASSPSRVTRPNLNPAEGRHAGLTRRWTRAGSRMISRSEIQYWADQGGGYRSTRPVDVAAGMSKPGAVARTRRLAPRPAQRPLGPRAEPGRRGACRRPRGVTAVLDTPTDALKAPPRPRPTETRTWTRASGGRRTVTWTARRSLRRERGFTLSGRRRRPRDRDAAVDERRLLRVVEREEPQVHQDRGARNRCLSRRRRQAPCSARTPNREPSRPRAYGRPAAAPPAGGDGAPPR